MSDEAPVTKEPEKISLEGRALTTSVVTNLMKVLHSDLPELHIESNVQGSNGYTYRVEANKEERPYDPGDGSTVMLNGVHVTTRMVLAEDETKVSPKMGFNFRLNKTPSGKDYKIMSTELLTKRDDVVQPHDMYAAHTYREVLRNAKPEYVVSEWSGEEYAEMDTYFSALEKAVQEKFGMSLFEAGEEKVLTCVAEVPIAKLIISEGYIPVNIGAGSSEVEVTFRSLNIPEDFLTS